MRLLCALACALLLSTCAADLSEDFEHGMGDHWSSWSDDNGGHWIWHNSSALDIPQRPAGHAGIVAVEIDDGRSTAAAHLYSPLLEFPAGSRIRMSFWIRSQYTGATNLILKRVEGGSELNPFLDLTEYATPDNDQWRDVEAEVPAAQTRQSRICVFGFRHDHPLDAIAVDDLVLVGVDGSTRSIPLRPVLH